jgi:hypothetical protein
MAGFEVIIYGRFWVITEGRAWRTAEVSLGAQLAIMSSHFPRLCTHEFTEKIDEHHLFD